MDKVIIPDWEYKERIKKAAKFAEEKDLDVFLVTSNEADYANVRYFTRFWPLFEIAGVVISSCGEAALLVGPESMTFAEQTSKIDKIFMMREYRESADPVYPELKTSEYTDVFRSLGISSKRLKIGIGSSLITPYHIIESLKKQFPGSEIIRADDIMTSLRSIKSENELACMRESLRISNLALKEVKRKIKPGMTELQAVGIAQKIIYENGAEYEGFPMYVFGGNKTKNAISRAGYRKFEKGDIVQLGIGARYEGYSPCSSYPVGIGELTTEKRDIIEFGLSAFKWAVSKLKAGVAASSIAKEYINFFQEKGFGDNYLYGPCHGVGMIEVEPPWIETSSEYLLKENMTFEVDTFVSTEEFGVRWETAVVITADGCFLLSDPLDELYEIKI